MITSFGIYQLTSLTIFMIAKQGSIVITIDVDLHWSDVQPDLDPQKLVNADPDPDPDRIQVNIKHFSKHLSIFRRKKNSFDFEVWI